MNADAMARLERVVLKAFATGPNHSTSTKAFRPVIARLVKSGLLRRFKVPPTTVALWIEITAAGMAALSEGDGK